MFPIKYFLLCVFYFRILIDNDSPQLSILRCCNHCYPLIFPLVLARQIIYIYPLGIVTCCLFLSLLPLVWAGRVIFSKATFLIICPGNLSDRFFCVLLVLTIQKERNKQKLSEKKETNKTNKMLLKQ